MKKILSVLILNLCTIAAISGSATRPVTPGNEAASDSSVLTPAGQASQDSTTLIYRCEMKKMIAAPLWRSVKKSFAEADSLNADFMLIHMNTYGGQVDIADSMRTLILNYDIPVMVFIDNQAISAGALIAVAADSIYMRSGASIGAATVVDQSGQKMPDKYQSFMRGMMRATAEAHGKKPVIDGRDTTWVWHRDPEIAQAMVDPSIVLRGIVDTGQVLTLTALEAIKYGFCEGQAETVEEVIENAGIKEYTIKELKLTLVDKIIMLLVNPVVSGLLIMLIIGGIYFELQSPGVGFPLAAALFGALLYFAPLYLEGVAANWHVVIFVAGVILLLVEIFAVPGFGVTGVLGIIGIVTGLALVMVDKIVFRFGPSVDGVKEIAGAFAIVILSAVLSFVLSLWLSRKLFAPNRLFGSLALETSVNKADGFVSFDTGKLQSLVGSHGVAHTVLRPSGKVMVGDEVYPAVAETGFIARGTDIIVRREEQGQLYVVAADKA
ncbi:MAG TPA: nodulation protein NfeD [Bacteroidales bacterium]|jgi:membrane-bound serine protease (ClpP class)|nr:nodulation protein NfeD [Bacteroidales bacterium]HNX83372.1 nodulation protein NfeD [Bacteroidales bacterium]HOC49333.1 nodulation protein NfeD [Bacteroidales bacterium]HPS97713.1 nodulation protein NfeD [Bacteroidales bacterium]